MKVIVAGNVTNPILLNTDQATALLVETDDGSPAVVFQMLPNGKGYIRATKGEDKNFNEIVKQLGLN